MTSTKRKNKSYTHQFKEETVALVTEQDYSVIDATSALGVQPNQIYNWKKRIAEEKHQVFDSQEKKGTSCCDFVKKSKKLR